MNQTNQDQSNSEFAKKYGKTDYLLNVNGTATSRWHVLIWTYKTDFT